MTSASACEPSKEDLPPLTRADLETARRMVRRCGVADEVDDVVQEVAIALAAYAHPLRVPPGRTPAEARRFLWWGFVRLQAARHRVERARQRARGGELLRTTDPNEADRLLERARGASPSHEDRLLERARITLLRAAVDELAADAPELHAVLRAYLDGAPMPRIADTLGIPPATAWNRWRLGCAAVRARLRQWAASEARAAVSASLAAGKRARLATASGQRPAWSAAEESAPSLGRSGSRKGMGTLHLGEVRILEG